MEFGIDFWVGAIVGAVVGLVLERLLGRPLDLLLDRTGKRTAQHLANRWAEKTRAGGSVLSIGDEVVFVQAFDPRGLHLDSGPLRDELDLPTAWEELPERFRPDDAQALFHELEQRREAIAADSSKWNEERVGLARIHAGRIMAGDRPSFELVFHPTDFAATKVLGEHWMRVAPVSALRDEPHETFSRVLPGLSHSFGINATVVTSDGQLVLVRRSARTTSHRSLRHISVNEGMNRIDLNARHCPDPVQTLRRGIEEELGVADVPVGNATFHALILDATRYQWAALGHVDLAGTDFSAERFDIARRAGLAADGWENSQIEFVPFTPERVLQELKNPDDWIAHGWLNLIYTAIASFPRRAEEFAALLQDQQRN